MVPCLHARPPPCPYPSLATVWSVRVLVPPFPTSCLSPVIVSPVRCVAFSALPHALSPSNVPPPLPSGRAVPALLCHLALFIWPYLYPALGTVGNCLRDALVPDDLFRDVREVSD